MLFNKKLFIVGIFSFVVILCMNLFAAESIMIGLIKFALNILVIFIAIFIADLVIKWIYKD